MNIKQERLRKLISEARHGKCDEEEITGYIKTAESIDAADLLKQAGINPTPMNVAMIKRAGFTSWVKSKIWPAAKKVEQGAAKAGKKVTSLADDARLAEAGIREAGVTEREVIQNAFNKDQSALAQGWNDLKNYLYENPLETAAGTAGFGLAGYLGLRKNKE